MSFKPKTIRRSPAQVRKYMRAYNDMSKGLRTLRKLIEAEILLSRSRQKSIKATKSAIEEAEILFKDGEE